MITGETMYNRRLSRMMRTTTEYKPLLVLVMTFRTKFLSFFRSRRGLY